MTVCDKTDFNCDYNGVADDEEDDKEVQIRNHVKYKDDVLVVKSETFRKLKKIVSHVGLLVALMLYTAAGGLVRIHKLIFFNNSFYQIFITF